MACLINKETDQVLAQDVIMSRSIFSRMKGLIGRKDLPFSNTFWILPCSGGIHTFFMQFAIDVIFVNRGLQITCIFQNIVPWRIVHLSVFSKTYSVFEFKTPALNHCHLQQGDQLHVGH